MSELNFYKITMELTQGPDGEYEGPVFGKRTLILHRGFERSVKNEPTKIADMLLETFAGLVKEVNNE